MSHFTTIKTQIKDIQALRSACDELGLSLVQNGKARGYSTNKTKGDYVIRLKGPYDIALNQQPDGSFGITADLKVSLPGLERGDAQRLVDAAHQVCPYSNATRGNVNVGLTIA